MSKEKNVNLENKSVIEPNSKPHIINRIISGLIDACIVFLTFTILYGIFLNTPISNTSLAYRDEMIVIQDSYLYSTGMGYKEYDFKDNEDYASYRIYKDDQDKEYVIVGISAPSDDASQSEWNIYNEKFVEYNTKLNNDASYASAKGLYTASNFALISLDALIVEGIFFLAIPLIDKKRRTIGKMIAKTQLFSTKHQGRVRWHQVVGSFAWKLIVESLIPFVFLNQATVFATSFINLIFAMSNRDNKTFHDLVSRTKVITVESYKPMFCDSITNENGKNGTK